LVREQSVTVIDPRRPNAAEQGVARERAAASVLN